MSGATAKVGLSPVEWLEAEFAAAAAERVAHLAVCLTTDVNGVAGLVNAGPAVREVREIENYGHVPWGDPDPEPFRQLTTTHHNHHLGETG